MTGWPWPLDGIQQWFEGLWNWISEAATAAVQPIANWINGAVQWAKDRIMEGIGWLWNQVKPLFGPLATMAEDAVKAFWDALISFARNPIGTLASAFNSITSFIAEKTASILNYIGSQVSSLASYVSQGLSNVASIISEGWTSLSASISKLWNDVSAAVGKATEAITTDIGKRLQGGLNFIQQTVAGILRDVAAALGSGLQGFFDWLLKGLGWMAEMVVGAVNFVVARTKDFFGDFIGNTMHIVTHALSPGSPPPSIATATSVMVKTVWDRQLEIIRKAYGADPQDPNGAFLPPEAYTRQRLEAAPSGEDLQNAAWNIIAGLVASVATMLAVGMAADAAHPFKNLQFHPTIREIVYWSGIPAVTASIAVTPTAIGLLEPLRYALNEEFQPAVPPTSDLIRFALREVWLPERRDLLLAYYPGEPYETYMKKQGYHPEFARDYWAAHWYLPTIEQLNRMLYRGVISEEEWRREVRYNDYVPYAIEWLEKIIYEPWTRVDVRRMYEVRTIDEETMYREYRWGGYDDEHARGLVLWTKVYTAVPDLRARYRNGWISSEQLLNELKALGMPEDRARELYETIVKAEQATRMNEERSLAKSDILRLLKLKIIAEDQAREMLKGLGYDDNEANFLISLATYEPQIELKELTQTQILKAYRMQIYDRRTAKDKLVEAGWSEEAAEILLEIEDRKKEMEQQERIQKQDRELTKSDILRLFKLRIITKEQTKSMLKSIGFDDEEADFLIALQEHSLAADVKELTLSQIMKAYDYEIYDRATAKQKLVEAGWSESDAELLLSLEDKKREDARIERMRERDLTPSQIITAVKKNIVDLNTGIQYLSYLGYSDWEINVLLRLEGLA